MTNQIDNDLVRILLGDGTDPDLRAAVVRQLAASNPQLAKASLITLGERTTAAADVLIHAGRELARLSVELPLAVTDFDLRDMTETAYIAFSDWTP